MASEVDDLVSGRLTGSRRAVMKRRLCSFEARAKSRCPFSSCARAECGRRERSSPSESAAARFLRSVMDDIVSGLPSRGSSAKRETDFRLLLRSSVSLWGGSGASIERMTPRAVLYYYLSFFFYIFRRKRYATFHVARQMVLPSGRIVLLLSLPLSVCLVSFPSYRWATSSREYCDARRDVVCNAFVLLRETLCTKHGPHITKHEEREV